MKIKYLCVVATGGGQRIPGDVEEILDHRAKELITAGIVEEVKVTKKQAKPTRKTKEAKAPRKTK